MGRKTKEIEIDDQESRDFGRKYLITEMSATQGEKWALKIVFLLFKAGMSMGDLVSDEQINQTPGMEVVAQVGLERVLGALDFFSVEPLLDEMMGCVSVVSSGGIERKLMETDIEEIMTRLILRREIFAMHTSFFVSAVRSISTSRTTETADSEKA